MKSIHISQSADGSTKHVFKLEDDLLLEAVWIPLHPGVNLCLSCQIGCVNKCLHCATAGLPYKRDASCIEIQQQVHTLLSTHGNDGGKVHLLFMGMGEPMFNFDNVVGAIDALNADGTIPSCGSAIVSTSGVVPGINRLSTLGKRPALAVTIGAAPDVKRAQMIPLTKVYPLQMVIDACQQFQTKTGDRITFEVPLVGDFNSSPKDADSIASVLRGFDCEVVLIPFNPFASTILREPTTSQVEKFRDVLQGQGFRVNIVPSAGRDIQAGCGQLVAGATGNVARAKN